MPDNNTPAMPTHVDDYQPPQAGDLNVSVPAGFNPPPAPVTNSQSQPSSSVAPVAPVTPVSDQPSPAKTTLVGDRQLTDFEKALLDESLPMATPVATQPTVGTEPEMKAMPETSPTIEPIPAPSESAPPSVQSVADSAPVAPAATNAPNQALEAQNIFDLLGVSDGKPEEKEAFLDELQDVIWEDFLNHDAELLLTEQELAKLNELKAKGNNIEVQEEILVYLEKLIPDLEDMMMDKALELKEDMVMERIAGLREFHSQNTQALGQITIAEQAIAEGRWADASQILNSIK